MKHKLLNCLAVGALGAALALAAPAFARGGFGGGMGGMHGGGMGGAMHGGAIGGMGRAMPVGAIGGATRFGAVSAQFNGARFANALVRLNATPAEMTWRSGVDVLATKGGALRPKPWVFL